VGNISLLSNTDILSDFKLKNDLKGININNENIILNNNLILQSDFINNSKMAIRGSIIFNGGSFINRGKVYLIEKEKIEFTVENDINQDFQFTGLVIDSDITYLNLIVFGPKNSSINWSKKFDFKLGRESAFYFSNNNGLTSKTKIETGDGLYWNANYSGLTIYRNWRIILEKI